MSNVILGLFLIGAAIIPDPGTHFGEALFGVKLIPWKYINALMATVGSLLIVNALFS